MNRDLMETSDLYIFSNSPVSRINLHTIIMNTKKKV